MTDIVDLALAGDAQILEGLAVAVYSALETSRRPVRIWVIEDGIPQREQAALIESWRRVGSFAGATFVRMRDLPLAMPSWWARKDWPLIAAARFQLGLVLPSEVERCIYIDTDVIVGIDLGELIDLDLHGHPIGMALNRAADEVRTYLRSIGLDPDQYGNSGVLLIDVDAWRREDAARGLIEVGRNMPAKLWFFDQDMLNAYFKGRCEWLEERWNYRDAGVDPVGRIQHFAGRGKPWLVAADRAEGAGARAWHQLHQRTGYVAAPMPMHARLRKHVGATIARVRRQLVDTARGKAA